MFRNDVPVLGWSTPACARVRVVDITYSLLRTGVTGNRVLTGNSGKRNSFSGSGITGNVGVPGLAGKNKNNTFSGIPGNRSNSLGGKAS